MTNAKKENETNAFTPEWSTFWNKATTLQKKKKRRPKYVQQRKHLEHKKAYAKVARAMNDLSKPCLDQVEEYFAKYGHLPIPTSGNGNKGTR